MGRAGKALKTVLKTYGISQNKLAVALGIERSIVFRWFHEVTDPTAQTVVEIVKVVKKINRDAAQEFIRLYLGDLLEDEDKGQ